jgi:hypothetical protein
MIGLYLVLNRKQLQIFFLKMQPEFRNYTNNLQFGRKHRIILREASGRNAILSWIVIAKNLHLFWCGLYVHLFYGHIYINFIAIPPCCYSYSVWKFQPSAQNYSISKVKKRYQRTHDLSRLKKLVLLDSSAV